MMPTGTPYIPEKIVVHLGPPDSDAQNVTVTFPDYLKNVASSEIYPTWPENALRANIYAQASFALNRIYTEWYRSRGYPFDITNSTQYDQAFVYGRNIYDDISRLVDELFDSYLTKGDTIQPYFSQFCNGTTVTCEGLSQWGTVSLANQGYTPYRILQYYYGDDVNIVQDAPVRINAESYPGRVLREGDAGNDVVTLQKYLNRVSENYPAIPKISPVNGIFGEATTDAVKTFQQIFNLTQDGLVGKKTWYRLTYLYVAVKNLAELQSEGIRYQDIALQFPELLRPGDTGIYVRVLQYYLAVIGYFANSVPVVAIDGNYGQETTNAVLAFQQLAGLPTDGVVGRDTWNRILEAYAGVLRIIPENFYGNAAILYPGRVLSQGSSGEDVTALQRYLNRIAQTYASIPTVTPTGYFGAETRRAVIEFQRIFGLTQSGVVGAVTWDRIASEYDDLRAETSTAGGQFAGVPLQEGMRDNG